MAAFPGFLNLDEIEPLARERLSGPVYDYFAGGSDDEVTVRENREAFRRIRLLPRVLVDVSSRDLSTTLLGAALSSPLLVAPMALQRMADPEGEKAAARAAAAAGALFVLSTVSSVSLEEVAATAPGAPRWFQLYHMTDRLASERLVKRAVDAGYGAIVLTVDAPLLGRRERDLRNPFTLPEGVSAVHLPAAPRSTGATSALNSLVVPSSLSWRDLEWIRAASPLPLVVKGVVRPDDACRAVEAGVDAVWVSNHGGRQLDTTVTTAEALPLVAAAVGGRVPLIVDGGIRRGTDALKALALGASAVALGRPVLWGLAAAGEGGAKRVLDLLREELSLAMAIAGCPTLASVDGALISGRS